MDDDEDLSSLLADGSSTDSPDEVVARRRSKNSSRATTPPLNTVSFVDPLASGRLGVEAVSLDGRGVALETMWYSELPKCLPGSSVEVGLTNGMAVVVSSPPAAPPPGAAAAPRRRWQVIAKDAPARRLLLATFHPHEETFPVARLLFRWLASQFVADASATLVLALAAAVVISQQAGGGASGGGSGGSGGGGSGGGAADGAADGGASGGAEPSSALDWPGGWLLGALFVAVALRCARQLRETFPPRASHTLLIKRATHAALEERADEQKPIKRTISNLFLRRQTEELEPSATELGPDSSAIARITSAFRRCAAPADGGGVPASAASPPASPGGGDGYGYEIMVGPLLDAFPTLVTVGVALGPSFFLLVKNDEGNLVKARRAWSRLSEESVGAEARCATLRGLLEAEVATGVHQTGGVLGDPSAAIAVLWLRRTLQFLLHVLGGLCAGSGSDGGGGGGGSPSRASPLKIEPEQDFKEMVRTAYAAHLEPFHGWLLRNCYVVALNTLPKRDELLQKLAPGVEPVLRERVCVREARECIGTLRPLLDAMRALFEELDLEDLRKAPWI